ncbi:MAG: methylated-DNA--[protein]-cysteine S-methyltransferase [Betaproteobacteria bacterium]|nr:methylated-DNA--[protein]-cysteine S-methyltransferase [Casimicrobiaceae bacterium]
MTSPLGDLLLVANASGDALCGVYVVQQKYFPMAAAQWQLSPRLPLFRRATAQLRDYFAGARTTFDLSLAPEGTAFQQDVWSKIRAVPFGETITYAELARRCGRPRAIRAAGAATGRNPLMIVVPCHRIMGSGGALTGYAGGLDRKRALLELESRDRVGAARYVA